MIAIRSICLSIFFLSTLCAVSLTANDDGAKAGANRAGDSQQDKAVDASMDSAKVMAVFQKYCLSCHSDNDPEGDVIVSSLTKAVAGKSSSGKWIVAGVPSESLIYRTMSGELEPKMPPEEEPQPTPAEIELVRAWIAGGAKIDADHPTPSKQPTSTGQSSKSFVSAAVSLDDSKIAVGRVGKVEFTAAAGNQVAGKLEGDKIIAEINGFAGKITSLRLSADGKLLVVGSGRVGVDGEVALVDLQTQKVIQRFKGHNDIVYCASLSPDGKWLASGSYDRKIILWDVATGQPTTQLTGHNGAIYDVDFNPTGKILATASGDQTVKLWSVPEGARLDTLGQPEGEMRCVRFSGDGKLLYATGADRQIRQWLVDPSATAGSPMQLARFAHEREVLRMTMLNDQAMVTASADGTVKLWSMPDLLPLGELATIETLPIAICAIDSSKAIVVDLAGNRKLLPIDPARLSMNGNTDGMKAGAKDGAKDSARIGTDTSPSPKTAAASEFPKLTESEPNNQLASANAITLPVEITGTIQASKSPEVDKASSVESDVDLFEFTAEAGKPWIVEVFAAKEKSALDSLIDILDQSGKPVLQTRLQAVRESYFTFRGKDSATSDDFRMHKWEDMELDEYLYSSGEVTRLWLYPRGPDSGFKVYPGAESRYTFFSTTPVSHALGEPAYIVRPLAADEAAIPNGLPVFPIYFENDDDPIRERGSDSRLTFRAPADGKYYLRIRDARGFSGENHRYRVVVREPAPDFSLTFGKLELTTSKNTGAEWSVKAKRVDEMTAAIAIHLHGLPDGIVATNPVIIGANQLTALGTVYASELATVTTEPIEIRLTAQTLPTDGSPPIERELKERIKLTINDQKQASITVVSKTDPAQELTELVVRPGQTATAMIQVERNGVAGGIGFGKEDSGRNLPHGCFVDNIGLSGLLVIDGQNSREVFITAAPKIAPGRYQFHFRSESKGNPTSKPIWLNVQQ